jgi:arylamine N-acetyltransferase
MNEQPITNDKDSFLLHLYRKRLHIPENFELRPNLETLRLLSENHLQYIPFENIALHSTTRTLSSSKNERSSMVVNENDWNGKSPIDITREALIQKILIASQGGCCLELNGLFSMLLEAIGYSSVILVPCFVFAGKERGHRNKKGKFRVTASHFVLLVTIDTNLMDEENFMPTYQRSNSFIVDVGLGEPSLWPFEYVLDKEQITPEGMRSRMVWDKPWVDRQGVTRQCIVLEWYVGGEIGWEPRLQWDINDAPLKLSEKYDNSKINPTRTEALKLESFLYVVPLLLNPKSNFAKKLVVCKLTRDKKVTLAGRVLKITAPRFGLESQQVLRDLETDEEVYEVLKTEFGINLIQGTKLCLPSLERSKLSKLWDHL